MPEISRFLGIVIAMYYNDHRPPHFHAKYGSEEVLVAIETGELLAGGLSPRAMGLVQEWRERHKENWWKTGLWHGSVSRCGESSPWSEDDDTENR